MGEDPGRQGRRGVDRLTIQEAARRLGVSEGAIRKRVARRTLRHDKGDDGRVYVYLDAGVDTGVDEGVNPNSSVLISQLRDEISYLREENRRKDEIIMQQAMTMRQLTAPEPPPMPEEPPQVPTEATEQPGRVEPQAPLEGAQEPAEAADEQQGRGPIPEDTSPQTPSGRSSWWRRLFG